MNPSTEPQASQPMPEQPTAAAQIGDAPLPSSLLSNALTAPTQTAGLSNTPQAAQDSDVIEKEWVLKAKQIIQTTQHDPFEQNRQLAALKADYMQKRYGRTVKVADK